MQRQGRVDRRHGHFRVQDLRMVLTVPGFRFRAAATATAATTTWRRSVASPAGACIAAGARPARARRRSGERPASEKHTEEWRRILWETLIELNLFNSFFCERVLLFKLDKQLPVEQFEASRVIRGSSLSVSSTLPPS